MFLSYARLVIFLDGRVCSGFTLYHYQVLVCLNDGITGGGFLFCTRCVGMSGRLHEHCTGTD